MHKTKKIGLLLLRTFIFSIFYASTFLNANQSSEQFISAKEQAENLWKTFQANREFKLFQSGKTDQALKEEIVYRLSLQRVRSVANPSQYIILHRLAESYLKQKASASLS